MLLLDTSALLWFVLGDTRMGPAAKSRLSGLHTVYFSSMSLVELEIKAIAGKLPVFDGLAKDFTEVGMTELPFKSEHSLFLREFSQLAKHDPFDRMLLAQAKASNFVFLTSDRVLLSLGEDWIVDARI